jgi:cytochrome c biogenesis protein CcdA
VSRFWPVLLSLGLVGAAQAGVPALTLQPLVESQAPAGEVVRLALQVTLPPGLHAQSNQPRDPTLIPTTLVPSLPDGFELIETVFPPATDFPVPGYDQPLAVFEQQFVVGMRVKVPQGQKAGAVDLPAKFRYQACNDRNCFPPKTVETHWTVDVVRAGTHPKKTHPEVFGGIRFGTGTTPQPSTVSGGTGAAAAEPAASEAATPAPASGTPGEDLALFDQFTVLNAPGGYMSATEFLTFIHDAESGTTATGPFEGRGPLAILALVFVGGLALNLTPCVLPMIPINLAIIGAGSQSRKRGRGFLLGATYGAAMAAAYGILGLIVILTAGTFGTINASAWFNFGIAALFVLLGLAMFDVISVDFSRYSSKVQFSQDSRGTFLLAFGMGAVAALLAGACVAPVVIQVVVISSNLYARGTAIALALPFVLGLGMALPWPIAGAGFSALPKPGAWMVRVKQVMGVFILATAAYYGYLGYEILANRWVDPASVQSSVADKVKEGWHASLADGLRTAKAQDTLVLVDLWATWCKNCLVMDRTTLENADVKAALSGYTRIKVQAEDVDASPQKDIMRRIGAYGLPAYAILKLKPADGSSGGR